MAYTEKLRLRIPNPSRQIELIVLDGAVSDETVNSSLEAPTAVVVGEFGIGGALNADRNAGATISGKTITVRNLSALGAATNMRVSLLVFGG